MTYISHNFLLLTLEEPVPSSIESASTSAQLLAPMTSTFSDSEHVFLIPERLKLLRPKLCQLMLGSLMRRWEKDSYKDQKTIVQHRLCSHLKHLKACAHGRFFYHLSADFMTGIDMPTVSTVMKRVVEIGTGSVLSNS